MQVFGTVKRLMRDRGFGFIRDEHTGQEYFFHRSGMIVPREFDELTEGSVVQGEADIRHPKGPRMESVTAIDPR